MTPKELLDRLRLLWIHPFVDGPGDRRPEFKELCLQEALTILAALELQAEHEALQTALQAVCRYLWNEQHWEFFRAEMLYFSDKERQSASEQNAEKIGEFMRDFISRFPQFEKLVKGEQ